MNMQADLFGGMTALQAKPFRSTARDVGRMSADAAAAKAERDTDFDTAEASAFVLGWLKEHGETPGEVLTDEAKKAGHVPHEDRAFGAVFQNLSRKRLIRCTGFCMRSKGHGTAGGRIWAITE